jgi:hypothetical protein
MAAIDPPRKRRGCFFYGCLTSVFLLLLLAVLIFIGARYLVNTVNAYILEYTDTAPMALPKVDMPEPELKNLQDRVAAFNQAMDAHTNSPVLILNSQEINALLANSPSTRALKDKVYVTLDGDQVKGQISLPLEKYFRFPMLKTKGRYLNGEGTFKVVITNSILWISMQSFAVKGKPLPENAMVRFRQQNLAAEANNNPTNAAAIGRFESVEVKDSNAIIKAK